MHFRDSGLCPDPLQNLVEYIHLFTFLLHYSVFYIWHAFGFLQLWVPIGCLTFVFLWPGFSFTFGCIFEFVFVHFVASGAGKH